MPIEPTKRKPIPQPKQMPRHNKRFQMHVADEAPMSATVSRTTPMKRAVRMPQCWVEIVVKGEVRAPTKAYSIGVAPGKVWWERKYARKIPKACQPLAN